MRKLKSTNKDCSDHMPQWGKVIIASFISFIFGIVFCLKFMQPDKPPAYSHSATSPDTAQSESPPTPYMERVIQINDPELNRKWDEDAAKRRLERTGSSAEPMGYRGSGGGGGYIDAETRRIAKDVYDFVNDPPDHAYEITITPE